MNLQGKVAVVTGGGAGIGRAIVHRLTDRWHLTVRRVVPVLDVQQPAGGPGVLSGPPAVGYPEPRSDSPSYGVQSEVPRED